VSASAASHREEPTLAAVLQQLLNRDERHAETAALMLQRQSDQNVAIQGLQAEVARLVQIADRQAAYNERQIALAEQMNSHARTFDRAFEEIEQERRAHGKLKEANDVLSKEIARAQGGTRMLQWLVGLGMPFLVVLGGFIYSTMTAQINDARADSAAAIADLKERETADVAAAYAQREALRADVRELQQARTVR
jgi:hypothetical protein